MLVRLMLACGVCALFAVLASTQVAQAVPRVRYRYVAPGGTGTRDCSTWGNACDLVAALAPANVAAGDEVWVKAGLYKPGTMVTSTFALTSSVAVYGGFSGTETSRDARNWQTNLTVLSGDVDGNPDTVDANGIVTDTANIHGTNAVHVVFGNGADRTAVMDGFTITAGNATGTNCSPGCGGGMYLYNAAGAYTGPTLAHLTFTGNKATLGGGLATYQSSPLLSDVALNRNAASSGGGMYAYASKPGLDHVTATLNVASSSGGGLYLYSSNPVTVTDSSVTSNRTSGSGGKSWGGGLFITGTTATLTRVTIASNLVQPGTADHTYGGGLYIQASTVTLTDSNVTNNAGPIPAWTVATAVPTSQGGGMLVYNSAVTVQRVTFGGNSAVVGGGVYNFYSGSPALTFTDVTFSANTAVDSGAGLLNYQASPTLRNVTFKNNTAGTNNIAGSTKCAAAPTDPTKCGGDSGGGGLYNYLNSNPTLENVTFTGNSGGVGGAIYNDDHSAPILRNVTVAQNTALGTDQAGGGRSAGRGAAIYNVRSSAPQIVNSVFWGNVAMSGGSPTPNQFHSGTPDYLGAADTSATVATYSDVQGGFTGTGNLDADPLVGALGTYGGQTDVLPLLPGSPALDSALDGTGNCPGADQRGVNRPQVTHCDMGAFESRGFQLSKAGGDSQSVGMNLAFPLALLVGVTGTSGEPVNGGRVTFTAPSAGASATFALNPAVIASGQASAAPTANSQPGAYAIQASAAGANPISFSITNVAQPAAHGKTSPPNGATVQPAGLSLSWAASAGAASYEYCYDTTNDSACAGSWTTTTATSAAPANLTRGVTYYWQVRARNASGATEANAGTWWSFKVAGGLFLPFIVK